jgi:hypothetical protein
MGEAVDVQGSKDVALFSSILTWTIYLILSFRHLLRAEVLSSVEKLEILILVINLTPA